MSQLHPSWAELHASIDRLDTVARKMQARREMQMFELSRDIMVKRTGIASPSVEEVQQYWSAQAEEFEEKYGSNTSEED